MTISVFILVFLVWLHLFADFVLQTDKIAINKSKSDLILGLHVGIYTAVFMLFCGWKFALFNGVMHYITDYISSRATTKFYKEGNRHLFFVVIGIDQAVHLSCLILTAEWIDASHITWLLDKIS